MLRNWLKSRLLAPRTMSCFSQVINPITGENSWQERGDDYDYHLEVANAGFGDMLHDWERNQKYFAALKKTIGGMRAAGREVHVLDIGTGTGILSMMALEAGADSVTACEAFLPMANCAEKILAANGVGDKVRLIRKRSTDIQVGGDMPQKANLLVAELLDTELIGEGAIGIYNHAHAELLTEDALCIPARARCYAQVAQSPLAAQWNSLKTLANLDGEPLLQPPEQLKGCQGEAGLHDVQLSQLPSSAFRPLTDPVEIFQFDFQRKQEREKQRQQLLKLQSKQPGAAELVFYWWDIQLDDGGEILLSCAPYWAHPELKELAAEKGKDHPLPNVVPWRDHWMQAIYYIPKPLQLLEAGKTFHLSCHHDEYSLWFDAREEAPTKSVSRHTCSCDLHMTYSRSRIGQINQAPRNKRYLRYLEEYIEAGKSNVLVLGNGCLLGLASSALGAASVQLHEPHRFSRRLLESIVQHNKLKNVQFVEKVEELENSQLAALTHIFAEPYFLNAILPWDNFYFGTLLMKIKDRLPESVQISPCSAKIYALPMEFLDLHKIRAPVGSCEGFDLRLFDQMVERSAEQAVSLVEAQPLWEYPCRALSEPQEVLNVEFSNFSNEHSLKGSIELKHPGTCNGVALWVDWQLVDDSSPKSTVSSGPSEPVIPGAFVKWDMFVRQGVHFPRKSKEAVTHVEWSTDFKPLLGELNFSFSQKKL
ncbi:protein arginine N-methyltransferase 7 [Drosophila elegans]|uniref:protein arginine N-methyltransferase 7 n=1 Tax=Drosophila elegans TaxID=30023 RepID=UPI0007E682B3|nr:protein arginine N-methyltransferase 7 [Drosophila elegans]